jgi:hypothetical protein
MAAKFFSDCMKNPDLQEKRAGFRYAGMNFVGNYDDLQENRLLVLDKDSDCSGRNRSHLSRGNVSAISSSKMRRNPSLMEGF